MAHRWLKEENIGSIPDLLDSMTEKMGKKTALIYMGRRMSYSDLSANVRKIALFVRQHTKAGDRVALLMPNIPQFAFCYYGILSAGRIAVPINFMSIAADLKTKNINDIKITPEILGQIKDAHPVLIFAADFFYPVLIQAGLDNSCPVILTSPGEYLPWYLKPLYALKSRKEGRHIGRRVHGVLWFKKIFTDFPEGLLLERYDPDSIAQLQYTGGTTGGNPKGAILTHRNLVSNLLQAREHFGDLFVDGEEVVMGALPFFHIYGMTTCLNMAILSLGAQLVLMPVFDPKTAIKYIGKYGVSVFPGVNLMYKKMLDHEKAFKSANLKSLKLCISGAGPIDKGICDKFRELTGSVVIVEGYGLSETSPVISVTRSEDLNQDRPSGFIGKPLPGTTVRIVGENGEILGPGLVGEIVVSGPQVMSGYYKKDNETKLVLDGGWFRTGDAGYLDADGYLYFTDRIKDVIKVLGENIYASDIEKRMMGLPLVAEAVVVGIPDIKSGETPVALVVLIEECEDNLKKRAEELIMKSISGNQDWPKLQRPTMVMAVDSLEEFKNPIGKILKRKIREHLNFQKLR
ncbi:MAG: hypothetical protein A3B99_05045 [Candidatus Yanofskybacteria bacterium RIFCSPHIGHO2_02_FULL_44_12b]|uniref:Long-chain fatty acid--CoA ligase n=2 Tax=Candidatus Yanofskyibacteriota TaxID=1752733 RepID=A0A1F8GJ50_9BACT|nr:MAG: Long-chain-fatty-acid-CoA ligase [Candidatus Yanofskybacteria bacterium GW2011_GWA2_44_9]OGN04246.1 MAG: hypothetical protein A2659_03100 [Candidatus Yanofskybacteria bacterium RIFCSPHIGHO2_01_FULL_44_24]OGN14353.1 MAG: hypothetical protein A3B99_05045 [Candidatus Yanofskybacteria bacterium RIFCSPHIGHO2_02_FULL_44_12b]OGN25353.1 MAG: hypothetical protein A2925_00610 [Candidatus Yanofskybacteria bacterium RIFCSPLOWO2_01_FULL_44_22]